MNKRIEKRKKVKSRKTTNVRANATRLEKKKKGQLIPYRIFVEANGGNAILQDLRKGKKKKEHDDDRSCVKAGRIVSAQR